MTLTMTLFHGRSPADARELDPENARGGWGFDGPVLVGVIGLHATYGISTVRIEFIDEAHTEAARAATGWEVWDENQLLVAWHEDLIRTCEADGFAYYGDWSLGNLSPAHKGVIL